MSVFFGLERPLQLTLSTPPSRQAINVKIEWQETDQLKLGPSFIDCYTTHPVGPACFTRLTKPRGMAGVVPTEVPYDCLIVDSYKLYVNEEGRTVYNHCGSAYLCFVDFTGNTSRRVSLKHENGTSGNGTVVVTVSATPSAVQPFPCDTSGTARRAWWRAPRLGSA